MAEKLSLDAIQEYLQKMGKRGEATLKIIERSYPYIRSVVETDIGKDLLTEDINRHEELLFKVAEAKASPEDMAEFMYIRKRLIKLTEKLYMYDRATTEVAGKVGK